ncbi:2-dehydropantoate 2-reductase [Aquibacillus halophilus]|uniref:2-dehydropantoate 2-reductase n=1 Tax=Aquibacillus halophilus TaxID=930132 RepID=A0A6A8DHB3_9BACI|nr:ketopantoate reductase family protein [Aquibacillus halophilus]MRH45063.1 2-dehydropantoate 2-reductase [Aquibacillus halophilus]
MEIKNVSIIGLGALGILYGNHLAKQMPKENIRIIADEERIKRYQRESVYCNDERCDFEYMTPEQLCEPADLIIFTVKYSGLRKAIEAVRNHVGVDTIILSALNGISSEGLIAQEYGRDKVLYCVAQGMDAVKEGNKLTYNNMGILCVGEREPHYISPKVTRLGEFFNKVKLPYELDNNMMKRQWGKFMLNVGVNQTVAVYESNYGQVQKQGQARDTMISAMREVIALSEFESVHLTEEDLNYWLQVLSTLNPDRKPSMRQDLEARRHSEVELFSGTVLALGEKYCFSTPVNQELYQKIITIEEHF